MLHGVWLAAGRAEGYLGVWWSIFHLASLDSPPPLDFFLLLRQGVLLGGGRKVQKRRRGDKSKKLEWDV